MLFAAHLGHSQGEGGPLCRASVLLQGHGAAPGAVARSPAAGTPTSAPEDQIDQQHFSFRLRLCGRRAWLARQWMLPRAAPESGTRGRISALPCLATPMSQYACCASLLLRTSTATQRAFSRWPAGRGGPGARAAVAVAAVVAATLCGSSLASARLHWRGAGVELGIMHRRKAGRALRRRSKEPDRWPHDGADGAAPRTRTAMGAVQIP